MKLNHHAALQAIGATMNKQHSTAKTEYWNLPASLEDKDDFYNVRETIPFMALLRGFRDSGFIVYLDKPKATDAMIAAAPDLLAVLELFLQATEGTACCQAFNANGEDVWPILANVGREARSAIAKARGE